MFDDEDDILDGNSDPLLPEEILPETEDEPEAQIVEEPLQLGDGDEGTNDDVNLEEFFQIDEGGESGTHEGEENG